MAIRHSLATVLIALGFLSLSSHSAISGPLCSLAPSGHNPQADQAPSATAMRQMNEVNNALCAQFRCPQYSFTRNQSVPNAMAWSAPGSAQIKYNPGFMNQIVSQFGPMATSGIFAHELGHIIDFSIRTAPPGFPRIAQSNREAAADWYAGCAFKIAGNPESDLQPLAASLHSMGASPGYPTPNQRVSLVREGYQSCQAPVSPHAF